MGSRSCIHLYSTLWIGCSTPDQKYPEALKKMPTLSCYHLLSLHLFCHHPVLCICYLDNLWSLLGSPAARGDSRVAMLLQSKICAGPIFLFSCRSRTMLMRHGVSHNPTQTPLWCHSPCHYCYYPVVQWPRTAGSPPGANSFSKALCHSLLSGLWLMTMRPNSKRMPKALPKALPRTRNESCFWKFRPWEMHHRSPLSFTAPLLSASKESKESKNPRWAAWRRHCCPWWCCSDRFSATLSWLLSECLEKPVTEWRKGTKWKQNKEVSEVSCSARHVGHQDVETVLHRCYCTPEVDTRTLWRRWCLSRGAPKWRRGPRFPFFGGLTS